MSFTETDIPALRELGLHVAKYDRSKITPGVVHIGPSHFARGHIFKTFDTILEQDPRWGVRAISLQTPNVRDALKKQDYAYTITERDANERNQRVIRSLIDVTVAPEDPQKALDVLCDPAIKLVTLTVTQKGYYYDPQNGSLDFENHDIQNCLSDMDPPSTAIGYLVAALEKRMQTGAPPLTIMSCDNMPANGAILKNVVIAYAARKSKELLRYIKTNITFPSTVVDRIVPRTKEEDLFNSISQGINDDWPIMTETFFQWIIENDFAGEVPNFAIGHATVTRDIELFELTKLRMVNGAHMALGCVAGLAGHQLVDQAMQDPQIMSFIKGFLDETEETINNIKSADTSTINKQWIIARLQNPHMEDELSRLARNGTQGKLKPRILDTIKNAIASGADYQHLAFVTAAWIEYLKGYDTNGNEFDILDENAIKAGLQDIARNSNGNPNPVMTASNLFDIDLMQHQGFMASVSRHLHNIQQYGVLDAIQKISLPTGSERTLKLVSG